MIRLLLYVLFIYLGYKLLKSWGSELLKPKDQNMSHGASKTSAELTKDPHCGTYFLKQSGVQGKIDGETFYFCSQACRDAYLLKHQSR